MEELFKISENYFNYMAEQYPVMCLSDEFYFFPRARKGIQYFNTLDNLDRQKIYQHVSYVKKLKHNLEKVSGFKDIDSRIDYTLLQQSMATFIREFEHIKIWQRDPALYLKISLLGTEHLITSFSFIKPARADIEKNLLSRLKHIPRLLKEARANLTKIPELYLKTALEMIVPTITYFKRLYSHPLSKKSKFVREFEALIKKIIQSVHDFKIFLKEKPTGDVFIDDRQLLEHILKESFSYTRSLEEIFEIALEEYNKTLKDLHDSAGKINPKKRWQEVLSECRIKAKNKEELLTLYSDQVETLKKFFAGVDALTIPETQPITVQETPHFLRPVRASASYSCPVTNDPAEPGFFYITAGSGSNNIHNEYIFLTAHETYPGHHVLDSIRRRLKNPIRQQIESPLFYEGWASYAEKLVDESGYVKNPVQRMIGLKRQAWRAVRAMLDAGIRIKKIKLEDARNLLRNLGYGSRLVRSMLRHYALTPGYQVCYTIGKFEIERLKEKFAPQLGLKKFHDFLLECGQIPFDLIEKRLENLLCRKNF